VFVLSTFCSDEFVLLTVMNGSTTVSVVQYAFDDSDIWITWHWCSPDKLCIMGKWAEESKIQTP